jgi:hypothetical protein
VQARCHRGYGRGKRESVRNEEENIEALTTSHDIPPSFNLGVHIAPFNTVSTVNVVLYNNREGTQALPRGTLDPGSSLAVAAPSRTKFMETHGLCAIHLKVDTPATDVIIQ